MDEFFPYTPRKTKFEVLEATFVARQALLDELKTSIREQADAETLQHWMILGLRGMGKSHLQRWWLQSSSCCQGGLFQRRIYTRNELVQ